MNKKNLLIDLLLIIITGGLWNIWMNYRQIKDFNHLNKINKYSFLKWLILTIITFGLYHIYHEYKLTKDIYELLDLSDSEGVALIAGIATFFGLFLVVDLYQQELLNRFISKKNHLKNHERNQS